MVSRPLLLALALVPWTFQASARWPRADERIRCGPLELAVYVSSTAHVFHLVDQLSAWDNACHGQYREHMTLSEEDEELLRGYAAVREKRRWGQGLEQTFYAPLSIEEAVRAGKKSGNLTDDEAKVIVPVLEHFSARANELLESKRAVLVSAFSKVDRARLTEAAEKLARFTGTKTLEVPVFPLASPAPGGGGMDGGHLRWEIDSEDIPVSVLLHELTHGFVMQKEELVDKLSSATPGLTTTLIGEAIAYAMAPGLYGDASDGDDNLRYNVTKDRKNEEAWEDPTYGRQRMIALAARPLLAECFEKGETLEAFLPRLRLVYLALREIYEEPVAASASGARPPGPPRLAIAGPAGDAVRARLEASFSAWIHSFNHDPSSYAEVLPQLGKSDLLVLLISGDDAERIPPAFTQLSPVAPDEIDKRLRAGKQVAETRDEASGLRVVLLGAPTLTELQDLVRKSPLLEPR
jgi:hypothetical protein